MNAGFVDIHSHLLPGVDDGCHDLAESLECARALSAAGYSHVFCTPHVWDSLPDNTVTNIRSAVQRLQGAVDAAGIPIRLVPGGEISLRRDFDQTPPADVVTAALRGQYVLIDFWAQRLPVHFEPHVKWFQSLGLTVILAHPERMEAVQQQPELADYFGKLGVLLQGNLQCISDPSGSLTRETVDRFLREDRYFAIGSDTHGVSGLDSRLQGLERLRRMVDQRTLNTLLVSNPRKLLPC